MSRPKLNQNQRKVRINITLDKSVYKNLKDKGLKLSSEINKLLRIAHFSDHNSKPITPNPSVLGAHPSRGLFSFAVNEYVFK